MWLGIKKKRRLGTSESSRKQENWKKIIADWWSRRKEAKRNIYFSPLDGHYHGTVFPLFPGPWWVVLSVLLLVINGSPTSPTYMIAYTSWIRRTKMYHRKCYVSISSFPSEYTSLSTIRTRMMTHSFLNGHQGLDLYIEKGSNMCFDHKVSLPHLQNTFHKNVCLKSCLEREHNHWNKNKSGSYSNTGFAIQMTSLSAKYLFVTNCSSIRRHVGMVKSHALRSSCRNAIDRNGFVFKMLHFGWFLWADKMHLFSLNEIHSTSKRMYDCFPLFVELINITGSHSIFDDSVNSNIGQTEDDVHPENELSVFTTADADDDNETETICVRWGRVEGSRKKDRGSSEEMEEGCKSPESPDWDLSCLEHQKEKKGWKKAKMARTVKILWEWGEKEDELPVGEAKAKSVSIYKNSIGFWNSLNHEKIRRRRKETPARICESCFSHHSPNKEWMEWLRGCPFARLIHMLLFVVVTIGGHESSCFYRKCIIWSRIRNKRRIVPLVLSFRLSESKNREALDTRDAERCWTTHKSTFYWTEQKEKETQANERISSK